MRILAITSALVLAAVGARAASIGTEPSGPRVVTTNGTVVGSSRNGVDVFYAIPFAAPPTGPLRFAAPASPTNWRGDRDASTPPPACPQPASGDPAGKASTSEDCLYLNVFRQAGSAGRPVLVWIHGGGWTTGWSVASQYDARRLAIASGATVVSINYRMGALGLLSVPALNKSGTPSGNWLLLDQIAALKWVRANISRFGGDPKRVTLFGESAGANSTLSLLASPAAAGLFNGAIVESATDDAHAGARDAVAAGPGSDFVKAVGCDTAKDIAGCLRALPVEAILKPGGKFFLVKGGAELPIDPFEAFSTGRYNRVPVVIGTNLHEAHLFVAGAEARLGRPMTPAEYRERLVSAFGNDADRVAVEYPFATYGSPAAALSEATSDARFACNADLARSSLAAFGRVWGYELAVADPPQQQYLRQPTSLPNTSYHTSDLAYVFDSALRGEPLGASERKLVALIERAWGGVAASGRPGVASWPAWTSRSPSILRLLASPVSDAGFGVAHHCGFWKRIGVVAPGAPPLALIHPARR